MIFDTAGIFWTHPFSQKTPDAPFALKEDSDRLLFALCIGSLSGWEISHEVGHAVAHHITHHLSLSTESPYDAFAQAALSARELLLSQFHPDEEWWPSSTALGGVIRDNRAYISWIGSETAWHFRDGLLLAATTAHTLGNAILTVWPHSELLPMIAAIPSRLIHSEQMLDASHIETISSSWHLISGDTLIFTTAKLIQHLNPQQVAQQLEGKEASQIAQLLLAMLPADENLYGAAAMVIRVKDA
jgi:hypothetical protein